jgi:hypothetical protein
MGASPRGGGHPTVHGVVFEIFVWALRRTPKRRCTKPAYSLTTATRSGATVTTGDPQ